MESKQDCSEPGDLIQTLGGYFKVKDNVAGALSRYSLPNPSEEPAFRFKRKRVRDLGEEGAVPYGRICEAARSCGLNLFNLELAVRLLLRWRKFALELLPDIDTGVIILAMEPMLVSGDLDLGLFYVEFDCEYMHLGLTNGAPGQEYLMSQEFLFAS